MFKKTLLLISALLLTLQAGAAAADDQFDLKSHAGKVVIVDFWASWCVPCRRSFPWLNAMQRKYGDQGLVIIGVNLDAERSAAKKFLEESKVLICDAVKKLSVGIKIANQLK